MNLSIIIPNYNGEKLLQKNLPKVLEAALSYKKGNIEIIIPNDPSTDNSQEVISKFITGITQKHIVGKTIDNHSKKESGFSKNINRGVSLATGDILILLNSDVTPHADFLDPLIEYFTDEKVFGVAFLDESIEDGKTVLRGRGIAKWQRGFFVHSEGNLEKNNTLWISGGSGAFRKSLWDKLHGMDPLYNPFYWEDIDLSYRALKSGYKIYFEKKCVVVHDHEKGSIRSKFKSQTIKKIAYRNQFIFVWKNITDKNLIISHYCWLPYHFLKALIDRDWVFFIGFYLALVKINRIRQASTFARKTFIRKDTDILQDCDE